MQKVTAICLHKGYQKIVNFTVVKSNGDLVPLIYDNPENLAYNYIHFIDVENPNKPVIFPIIL